MSEKIITNIEPLQNLQKGLIELRDHIRPIERKIKKVIDEYDCEIAETVGNIDEEEYYDLDQDEHRKRLEQKKADLQEAKAAIVAYTHARDEFLRALEVFYSSEGYASDSGLGMLGNSIAALENYLNAGRDDQHVQHQPQRSVSVIGDNRQSSKTVDVIPNALRKATKTLRREKKALFGMYEIDQHINGTDYFIRGNNYERFKRDYYSAEESDEKHYEVPVETEVAPEMIEGIHLGQGEIDNPSVFWSQHEKGGTLESFVEIASRIPDVRYQLTLGRTLEELSSDPELSRCVNIYFVNKPKVIMNDGYYEFVGNGRHRILAARAAGVSIPVEVIGDRK